MKVLFINEFKDDFIKIVNNSLTFDIDSLFGNPSKASFLLTVLCLHFPVGITILNCKVNLWTTDIKHLN